MCSLNKKKQFVDKIALLSQILHGFSSLTDMMLLINYFYKMKLKKRKNGAKPVASQFPNNSKLNGNLWVFFFSGNWLQ